MIGFSNDKLIIVVDSVEGYELVGGLQKAISYVIATHPNIPRNYLGYLANLLDDLAIDHIQAQAIAEKPQNRIIEAIVRTSK